jgi:hypothetical protein
VQHDPKPLNGTSLLKQRIDLQRYRSDEDEGWDEDYMLDLQDETKHSLVEELE